MAASVFDSPLYARLFDTGEAGRLFSDSATLRAMLLVEGALARAQGQMGLIPEVSAQAIHRATLEIQIDPGALASDTGRNGVTVPGLVTAFRAEMNAPEHAQYVHWGATSQDIIDTGLMLRLRQALALAEADLRTVLSVLADQTEQHTDTVMAARTYSQHATPTTWGAVLSGWGMPLADALEALPDLRDSCLWVSLSGASGTASALGPEAPALRAALATGLGLTDPQRSWHTDRGPVLRIAAWMAGVTATLGAMGHTLTALSSTDTGEVSLGGGGSSSTMPQKQNPVEPAVLGALAHQMAGLQTTMMAGAMHQHQRDGVAWFTEWMALPQITLTNAAALQCAKSLIATMHPAPDAMLTGLNRGQGTSLSEALSFALTRYLSRQDAQVETKALVAKARDQGKTLEAIARAAWPDLAPGLFDVQAQTGHAAQEARMFVSRVRAL